MRHTRRNPEPFGNRASVDVNLLGGFDVSTSTFLDDESLAVHLVANRFRLRVATAREVCRMAGIGGAA